MELTYPLTQGGKHKKDIERDSKKMSVKLEVLEILSNMEEFIGCNFLTFNKIMTNEIIELVLKKLNEVKQQDNDRDKNRGNKLNVDNEKERKTNEEGKQDLEKEAIVGGTKDDHHTTKVSMPEETMTTYMN